MDVLRFILEAILNRQMSWSH